MNINRIDKSGSCWPWYYSRSNIFTKVNYFWTFLPCAEHKHFLFFFFLTLEWAQLLVSVLYWMATISSSWSQGHLNSCPLAGIHIFPANALTNRSCFSLLKGLHLLHRAQPAKSGFSKVWTCQQEPSLSDKTLFLWFTWLFSSRSAVLVSLFISAPNQLEHSKSKSVLLGCEWVAQAGQ